MRHAVLDVKNDCFVRDTVNPDSKTQILGHREKNHVCGSATHAWVECGVYTPVDYKGIAIASTRNTLTVRKNYRSLHLDVCGREEDCHHERGCHSEEEELGDGFVSHHLQPSLGRHVQILRRAKRMVDLVVVELAPWDEVLGQRGQILDIDAL